jgi:prepilin-type N-terminal cleavage/methylation domain-containing protein
MIASPATNRAGAPADRRLGLTLVEVMVVMAIIAVLIVLLVPAVQSARESARRSMCSNQLRQLGQACLAYESTNGRFPYGAGDPVFPAGYADTYGIFVHLLPFIEQQSLYDSIVAEAWTPENLTSPYTRAQNSKATNQRVVVLPLACPSDASLGMTVERFHNYRVNWGDVVNGWNREWYRGLMGKATRHAVPAAKITDGVSNTIFFSESAFRTGRAWAPGFIVANAAGWGGLNQAPPAVCLTAAANPANWVPAATLNLSNSGRTRRWSYSNPGDTGFFTVLPPNSPDCSIWPIQTPFANLDDVYGGASSYHTGGVLGAMGDSSVRFIANEIDAGNPNSSPGLTPPAGNTLFNERYTGESKWGVWGAMGTIRGREAVNYNGP